MCAEVLEKALYLSVEYLCYGICWIKTASISSEIASNRAASNGRDAQNPELPCPYFIQSLQFHKQQLDQIQVTDTKSVSSSQWKELVPPNGFCKCSASR